MVTIELALALGSMVAVLACVIGGIAALLAQIAVVDAAREAARVAALAGTEAGVAAGQDALAGRSGGQVSVSPGEGAVSARAALPLPGLGFSGLEVTAVSVARTEPGVGDG